MTTIDPSRISFGQTVPVPGIPPLAIVSFHLGKEEDEGSQFREEILIKRNNELFVLPSLGLLGFWF